MGDLLPVMQTCRGSIYATYSGGVQARQKQMFTVLEPRSHDWQFVEILQAPIPDGVLLWLRLTQLDWQYQATSSRIRGKV